MTEPSAKVAQPKPAIPAAPVDSGQRRQSLIFTLGLISVLLSLGSGLATYLILTGFIAPIRLTNYVVWRVLLINLVPILATVVILAWQGIGLWRARKRQAAGAQLHTRVVGLFALIALVPSVLFAISASISLGRGLDYAFSAATQSVFLDSFQVAGTYISEHRLALEAEAVDLASVIDEAVMRVKSKPEELGEFLKIQAATRALPVAYLVDANGKMLVDATSPADVPYTMPPQGAIARANETGKPVAVTPGQTEVQSNIIYVVEGLKNFNGVYLYVGRPLNPRVLQQLRAAGENVKRYLTLEKNRAYIQVTLGAMHASIALALLLSAIWIAMWFAGRLVAPIRQLMDAARQVSRGNLAAKVDVRPGDGDLALLGSTFNTMTSELKSQRDELVGANLKLEERRSFIEAVLSGVTAGVVGTDSHGVVTLVNRSAETLLAKTEADLIGQSLAKAVPEFAPVLKRSQKQGKRLVTEQVTLRRRGSERNFAVRVTSEGQAQDAEGFVVTFDDMTELVSAQRSTAWADVARRIAHEIKNPLTPIQLSAERIRRKYGDSITKDREVFDQCTNTIIRQVSDIGRMVDEFSAFARMPKPVMADHDVREIVREAVFLFQVSRPEISFELDLPDKPVIALSDRRLLAQAVTNLVKNASEAIDTAVEADPARAGTGHIVAEVRAKADRVQITVIDNGCGLPEENRERLVEPYMTTRAKGTGLGLAIVQRITEQHGGSLTLADAPKRNGKIEGASVRIDFPVGERDRTSAEEAAPDQSESASTPAERAAKGDEEEGVTHGV